MSLFAVMALTGPGVGCVAAGWIEQNPHLEWRWIQWIHVMYGRPLSRTNVDVVLTLHDWQMDGYLRRCGPDMHEGDALGRPAHEACAEAAERHREPSL